MRRMGGGKVEGRTLRAMVRLLSMQGKGMFGDEDWLEFRKYRLNPSSFLTLLFKAFGTCISRSIVVCLDSKIAVLILDL